MSGLLIQKPRLTSAGRTIDLAAYDGTKIPNSIDGDPSEEYVSHHRQTLHLTELEWQGMRHLTEASGRYNCFGLVFASRRTNLFTPQLEQVLTPQELLIKDDFELVDEPQTGDVAVYMSDTNEIDHVGVVTRVEKLGETDTIFVWSKWGALGEYEHQLKQSPYKDCTKHFFWRLSL